MAPLHKSPPPMQPSTNTPPPPLQPPQQVSQPQPQESEPKSFDEIEDSQVHSWFQDIFPGQDFPPCLQPQQKIYQDSSSSPKLETIRKAKPLPWHESPERLLFLQLYPNLHYLCTEDSHLRHDDQVLAPSVSPPHSPPKQENVLAPPPLPHHSTSPLPKQADSCSS